MVMAKWCFTRMVDDVFFVGYMNSYPNNACGEDLSIMNGSLISSKQIVEGMEVLPPDHV